MVVPLSLSLSLCFTRCLVSIWVTLRALNTHSKINESFEPHSAASPLVNFERAARESVRARLPLAGRNECRDYGSGR